MTQQAYKTDLDVGVAGGLSAAGGELRIVTYRASSVITPGLAVSFDANGDVTTSGSASLAYAGIAMTSEFGGTGDGNTYAVGDLVPVADVASVWVTLTGTTASAVGGTIHRVLATGAITAAASGNTTAPIPNSRFESVATTGTLADGRFA